MSVLISTLIQYPPPPPFSQKTKVANELILDICTVTRKRIRNHVIKSLNNKIMYYCPSSYIPHAAINSESKSMLDLSYKFLVKVSVDFINFNYVTYFTKSVIIMNFINPLRYYFLI